MKKDKKFTLVELLVVIAVIAVLAGLLLPVMAKIKSSGHRADCKSNLRGIGQSIHMYLNDSGDLMPVAAQLPTEDTLGLPRICDVLAPCIDTQEAFKCPADVKKYYETEGSSYEYNMMLSGRKMKDILSRHLKNNTFMMFDYEPFHGKAGQKGSTNYLFVDGRVSDLTD